MLSGVGTGLRACFAPVLSSCYRQALSSPDGPPPTPAKVSGGGPLCFWGPPLRTAWRMRIAAALVGRVLSEPPGHVGQGSCERRPDQLASGHAPRLGLMGEAVEVVGIDTEIEQHAGSHRAMMRAASYETRGWSRRACREDRRDTCDLNQASLSDPDAYEELARRCASGSLPAFGDNVQVFMGGVGLRSGSNPGPGSGDRATDLIAFYRDGVWPLAGIEHPTVQQDLSEAA